jgi:dihydroorotate dehydrogenase (NAD+) catalytic subunit
MPNIPAVLFDPSKTFEDNVNNGPYKDSKYGSRYFNKGEPKYRFLGHKLYSPFGIAAGSLPTSKHVSYAFDLGFDVVTYKTQRSVPFEANQFPNIVYLDLNGDLTLERAKTPVVGHLSSDDPVEALTITNSFGNPSLGPDFWVEDMKKAVKSAGKGQLMVASVVGTIQPGFTPENYYDDFANAAALAKKAGVEAIELNLSCPNVASEGVICYNLDAVISISKKAKAKVGDTPLIAKVGYFSKEQEGLLEKIVLETAPYISAFSAINTIPAKVVDDNGQQLLPGEGRLSSGACGRGVKWAGIDMVKRLVALRKKHNLKFEIIGVGGVATPKDFHDYLKAGADIVQCVTAAMWNAGLAQQIKDTLV